MTKTEMLEVVKANLNIDDDMRDLGISDVILHVCDYCNLNQDDIPDLLEPFVRKKFKGIIDYEAVKDGTITYATGSGNSREGIYELSDSDKMALRRFRRLRGYA